MSQERSTESPDNSGLFSGMSAKEQEPAKVDPVIRNLLVPDVDFQDLSVWIKPLKVEGTNSQIRIICPNNFHRSKVQNFLDRDKINNLKEEGTVVQLVILEDKQAANAVSLSGGEEESSKSVPAPKGTKKHLQTDMPLFMRGSDFDTFVVCGCNDFAAAAARNMANGKAFHQILVLVGGNGLGKTHLAHAVGRYMHDNGANVLVTSTTEFVSGMAGAFRSKNGAIEDMKKKHISANLLLFDDIHEIVNKETTQKVLVEILEKGLNREMNIIFTSTFSLKSLKLDSPKLQSLLGCRLEVPLDFPSAKDTLQILRGLSEQEKADIPGDVLEEMAVHLQGNDVYMLRGAIVQLLATSSIKKRPMTISLWNEIRNGCGKRRRLTLRDIAVAVCDHSDDGEGGRLKLEMLRGESQKKIISQPRSIAIYLARKHLEGASFSVIAGFFNRDSSTAQSACKQVKKNIAIDGVTANKISAIEAELGIEGASIV